MSGGQIAGARVTTATGTSTVNADHYVLAVPVERAVPLLDNAIPATDPSLASLRNLTTDWMNGVMLYLKQPLPLSDGHVTYPGQPWALTSISQAQFWQNNFAATYGDGTVRECLSLDVSAWDEPGILYGKPAKQCTPAEIINEIKAQLRRSIPLGSFALPDSAIHSYFIDPAITGSGTPGVANDEPLLINTPGSWQHRPEATTSLTPTTSSTRTGLAADPTVPTATGTVHVLAIDGEPRQSQQGRAVPARPGQPATASDRVGGVSTATRQPSSEETGQPHEQQVRQCRGQEAPRPGSPA